MKKQSIIGGVDIDNGEKVLTDDPTQAADFWKDVHQSESWQRYLDDYGNTSENNDTVLSVLDKLHGEYEFVTTGFFIDALDVAMNAGELQRIPQEEPEPTPEPVPVDENNRPLSASQIAWGEMTRWSQGASSAQIKERCRVDEAYARFHKSCLKKEMDQPIGDDVTLLNPHIMLAGISPTSTAMKNEHLVAFANRYRQMSSEEVRKAKRLDYNPLTARQFNLDEAAAIDANLI